MILHYVLKQYFLLCANVLLVLNAKPVIYVYKEQGSSSRIPRLLMRKYDLFI